MRASEALRAAIRSRVLPGTLSGDPADLATFIALSGGEGVLGLVFFGSRKTDARPDSFSAYDLFVLTKDYRPFYRHLWETGALRKSPNLLAALNVVLPPNQVSLRSKGSGAPWRAKCAVISLESFVRDASKGRRDHFCIGRLFQPTEVIYVSDPSSLERILDAIANAHTETFSWARPWLPDVFDVSQYCRTLLTVSLGQEIRPEPSGRARELWEAQKAYLQPVYSVFLEDLLEQGELVKGGGGYSLARAVTSWERTRIRLYFRWSLVRATARWGKYIVTFDDWLEYILRKAERHAGHEIVLTEKERRLPLLFLWPKLVRYLRQKDRRM
jgi:hypothetical protein